MNNNDYLVPTVIEKTAQGERAYDIYSRLLKDRVIMLGTQVDAVSSSIITAQLLFLEHEDNEKPIFFYINSPGGSVYDGFAIYDCMNFIKAPVYTTCLGMAMSMGALLLSAGEKGHRFALPNSTIMIHQVSSGTEGKATDMLINLQETLRLKERLTRILAKNCGKEDQYDMVVADCERDKFLSAEDAKEYGLIDDIITSA